MTSPGTTVTFTGGLRTPSGTRFHVSAGGWRACFDLGLAFAPATSYFDGRIERRADRLLADLLALGLAPALPGLYHQGAVEATGLPPGPDGRTAVFISHLHLDHMGLLPFVADGVPVYMSPESALLLRQLERAGLGSGVKRGVESMQPGEAVSVGELRVTSMPVDHDIPGAVAFLIDTPDGTLVYSGDLRTHGYRREPTEAFLTAAAARRPRALVIETSRMGEEPVSMMSEAEVVEELVSVAGQASGLVLAMPYPRNLERLGRLPEVARRAERRLVVEPAIAQLLATSLPADVGVYGESVSGHEGIDEAAIRSAPHRYVVQISYPRLAELIDLRAPGGSVLVHSDGEPLGAFDPAHANLLRWLDRFGIAYRLVRSSGHANPAELVRLAAGIAPDVIFPLHGYRPDLLIVPGARHVLPTVNVPYLLDGSPASY